MRSRLVAAVIFGVGLGYAFGFAAGRQHAFGLMLPTTEHCVDTIRRALSVIDGVDSLLLRSLDELPNPAPGHEVEP